MYWPTGLMVETPYAAITILQGDEITISCVPSEADVALQWSFNGTDITSSLYYQFTPHFLNHNLTISRANDTASGTYVCAFRSKREAVEQSVSLTVVPSECLRTIMVWLIYIAMLHSC